MNDAAAPNKEVVMCSACLLGFACRYDGKAKTDERVLAMADRVAFVPFCPEQMAGFPTPRPPAEGRSGRIFELTGTDVTEMMERGAAMAVEVARLSGARRAVLRTKSPSCGADIIPNGEFNNTFIPGLGVTARALKAAGVEDHHQQSIGLIELP